MKLEDLQEGHFYRLIIKGIDEKRHDCIAKCTQIQNFKKNIGYNVYHFKYFRGELVFTDEKKYYMKNYYYKCYEIKYEIIDKVMCDTSIEFIDDTHYKKLVNKDTYKIYEVK